MKDRDRQYGHVARAVFDTPWFIREAEGTLITGIVRQRLSGLAMSDEEIVAAVESARQEQGPRSGGRRAGAVAVIPIYGLIMPRANLMTEMSGGTTVGAIRASLEEALNDDDVTAIVAEFDSPGGVVDGIEELATWIRAQRGRKPMVAVSNTMCCSAALYLAAQFDEIVASPSSLTGDIGVFMEHVEFSQAEANAGIKTTIIRRPEGKHDPNDVEPLSDDARAYLDQMIGDYYSQFIASYAKGRGISVGDVRKGHGQGRSFISSRAVELGLADRVDTLEGTVRRLATARVGAGVRAEVAAPYGPTKWAVAVEAAGINGTVAVPAAQAATLAQRAPTSAAGRADEGRDPLESTREGAEPEPATPPAGRRRDLELLEAASRGGYSLQPQHGGTVS